MKTFSLRAIVLLFIILLNFKAEAQSVALTKANDYFNTFAYTKAVDIYEKLYQKSPSDHYLIQQLAYSYEKMGIIPRAIFYYQELVKTEKFANEDLFVYAELLIKSGQFDEASKWFSAYLEREPNDMRATLQLERIQNLARINQLILTDSVTNWPYNTRFSDIAPMFRNDEFVFVSARDSSSGNNYSYNNQPFLDIYEFVPNKKGEQVISKMPNVNTRYHEGPLTFTNQGNTIWFTRNNQQYSSRKREGTNNLKIYTSEWDGRRWVNEKEFPLNSDIFSVGHPAFSPDEKTMYFASDMPGTLGETDIYKVSKTETTDENGNKTIVWGEPEDLGPKINTKGKEMFPFVDSRGLLFFASDGWGGYGGLDVYVAYPVADSFMVMNLGQPINSSFDDFGLIVSKDFSNGYLASNRLGGKGDDDIYQFNIRSKQVKIKLIDAKTKVPASGVSVAVTPSEGKMLNLVSDSLGEVAWDVEFRKKYVYQMVADGWIPSADSIRPFEFFNTQKALRTSFVRRSTPLAIQLSNSETGEPISGAEVFLDFDQIPDQTLMTDDQGKALIYLLQPDRAKVVISKKGFIGVERSIQIEKIGEAVNLPFEVEPVYEGKTVELKNLYYETNSSELNPDAEKILDELLNIINKNPKMVVEIGSHTDSRATAQYNLELSQKRTQSAVDYLISKGVAVERLIAKGYGESMLLNHCSDGVECTEEEHQQNRRTEFKIISF